MAEAKMLRSGSNWASIRRCFPPNSRAMAELSLPNTCTLIVGSPSLAFARTSAKAICAAKAKMRYTVGSGLPVAVANVCLRPVAIANQYLSRRPKQSCSIGTHPSLAFAGRSRPAALSRPWSLRRFCRGTLVVLPTPCSPFVVRAAVLAPWSGTLIRHAVPAPWPGTLVWPFAVLRWSLFVAVSWSPCRAVTYRELRREEN